MNKKNPISQTGQMQTSLLTKKCPFGLVMVPWLLLTAFLFSCKGKNMMDSLTNSGASIAGEEKITSNRPAFDVAQPKKQYCSLKDGAGNFWLAAPGDGVYRYNGKSFTHFTITDGLMDNTVFTMLEDNTGNIWFGTLIGICRYDGKSFTTLPLPGANTAGTTAWEVLISMTNALKYPDTVIDIKQDSKGNLWFTTERGIYCFDGKKVTAVVTTGC